MKPGAIGRVVLSNVEPEVGTGSAGTRRRKSTAGPVCVRESDFGPSGPP